MTAFLTPALGCPQTHDPECAARACPGQWMFPSDRLQHWKRGSDSTSLSASTPLETNWRWKKTKTKNQKHIKTTCSIIEKKTKLTIFPAQLLFKYAAVVDVSPNVTVLPLLPLLESCGSALAICPSRPPGFLFLRKVRIPCGASWTVRSGPPGSW